CFSSSRNTAQILPKQKPFNQLNKSLVSRGWKAWCRPRHVQFHPCISEQRCLWDVTESAKNTQPICVASTEWPLPSTPATLFSSKDHDDCPAEHRECDGHRRKLHGRAQL
uniref:Uncharacterized protein n=1 Tax=Aegilops tauschii subsp. strangulata TaxID=200361 RepID=A0A453QLW6_AEGTS